MTKKSTFPAGEQAKLKAKLGTSPASLTPTKRDTPTAKRESLPPPASKKPRALVVPIDRNEPDSNSEDPTLRMPEHWFKDRYALFGNS